MLILLRQGFDDLDELPNLIYYHGDHLGSSSIITDGSGQKIHLYVYTPFGDESYSEPLYDYKNVAHRYTGQILDEETGLYYYNARYYDAEISRFIQADSELPSDSSQGLNRYSYCHANPVNAIDPTGMFFTMVAQMVVTKIQSILKKINNFKVVKILKRGIDPLRQRWKMWLIRSKGMPVHFGLWLEALNRYGRETGIGPYFDVNPTPSGYRNLISGSFSNVLRYFKVVSGKINVTVYPELAITGMATGKWKICRFTHAQFGLWTTAAVGAAYAEDLAVPVKFNLAFLPGTLNCTKWVAEAITLALPISILPI